MIGSLLERRRYMRHHRWAQARMSEYLDEELSPRERRRVERHVGVCPQCRRVMRTLRRTLQGLMALSAEPRPGLAEGVVRRLRGD